MLFTVPKLFQGGRLDLFLARHVKQFSRSQIEQFIKDGAVKINNHYVVKPAFKIRSNDRIVLLEEKIIVNKKGELQKNPNIAIDIVYEDENMLVVNKPAGILTHPTFYEKENTLVNWLLAHIPHIAKVGDNSLRPGLVHRLDKDTSGLLAIAKNNETFLFLKKQFADRKVEKKYFALVVGVPRETSGEIDYPITTWVGKTVRRKAIKGGDAPWLKEKKEFAEARTLWSMKEKIGDKYALLDVKPETGRTHQIRVHLAAIGYPIAGDELYGHKKTNLKSFDLQRQFLHAYYLRLAVPGEEIRVFEVGLPDDLEKVLQKLRESSKV